MMKSVIVKFKNFQLLYDAAVLQFQGPALKETSIKYHLLECFVSDLASQRQFAISEQTFKCDFTALIYQSIHNIIKILLRIQRYEITLLSKIDFIRLLIIHSTHMLGIYTVGKVQLRSGLGQVFN